MGSYVELNDTLQITTEQGFPTELVLERHRKKPYTVTDFKGRIFKFEKQGARVFPTACRCFLVHNIGGKWLYWGHILVIEQTIEGHEKDSRVTRGKFMITKIYDPVYQEAITKNESPEGISYFS